MSRGAGRGGEVEPSRRGGERKQPEPNSARSRLRRTLACPPAIHSATCTMSTHPVTQYVSPSAWALVEDKFSPFAKETLAKLVKFVEEDCIPAEVVFHAQVSTDPKVRWTQYPAVIETLKSKARSLGLWNLFLSKEHYPDVGVALTNLEYAVMAEIMGRAPRVAPEACNCSAPDTGNMEVLARYGTQAQKDKWLKPLLAGKTRSSFAMTEKGVASSE